MALALGLIGVAMSAPSQANRPSPQIALSQATLDRYAKEYLADRCRVGLSIAARIDGGTYFSNQGWISRVRRKHATADSIYELASVTKTFTGALAARALVDRRMTLDGDFRKYLPEDYPNLMRSGVPITLRSLATHTSGLQRDLPDSDALMAEHDFDHRGSKLAALNKGYTRARSLADLHQVTLRAVPGDQFAYSNLGIRVIGYGLETVYRASLEDQLRTAILMPLGMTSTGFAVSPTMRARLVTPYSRFGHAQPFHDASAGAAWGLYSTPRDMARYLVWQLDRQDPVIAQSHALIRGTADDGQASIWNLGKHGDEPILWHGGGSFGETSQVVLFPADQEGFVLLANDACEGSETALKTLAIAVHDAVHPTTQ
jgi:serine-type D-Ala-D-Ala carboxypeptidase/endopeptidase